MNLAGLLPDTLIDAAEAVGLVSSTQELQADWFENPLSHIESILTDADQRAALFKLLDDVLPPEDVAGAPSGEKWHPLLGAQTKGNLYLTVNETASQVLVGFGGRYAGGPAGLRMEVPLIALSGTSFHVIAGAAASPISLALDVTVNWTRPAHPIALASISVSLVYAPAATPASESIVIILNGLDLDGSGARDVTLDPANLGAEASALILGLLREKLEEIAASAGGEALLVAQHLIPLLGLDGTLPALPFASLASDPQALTKWLLSLTTGSPPPMTAWLGHLAGLLGITAPAVTTVTTGKTTLSTVQLLALSGSSPLTLGLARGVAADGTTPTLGVQIGISLAPGTGVVTVEADVTLVTIPLSGQSGASVLPAASLVVQAGGGTPLIAPAAGQFSIDAVRAGIGWNGSAIAPLLELDTVVIPAAGSFPMIDLTNANTVEAAAASGLVGAVTAGLGNSGAGAVLAALAGLVPPSGDAAAPLVDFAQLVTHPTSAIAALHRNALLSAAHPWSLYLSEIGRLLGLTGTVGGSGTPADPWMLPLASAGPITASLAAWNAQTSGNAADPQELRLGLRAETANAEMTIAWSSVLLGADLPASGANHVTLFAEHDFAATFMPPVVSAGSTGLSATSLGAKFSLITGQSPQVSAAVNGLSVTTPAGTIALPTLAYPFPASFDPGNPGPALGITAAELETLISAMLASAFGDAFGVAGQALAVLLGAGAGAPGLDHDLPSIADAAGGTLFSDPAGALRLWLAKIATTASAAGTDFTTPVVGWLSALLANDLPVAGVAPDLTTLAGSGLYDDPWILPLGGAGSAAQGLLWLEPAGPQGGTAPAAAAITAAADVPGLIAAITRAHRFLGSLPEGIDATVLATGLQAVADHLTASDGVVPVTSQLPAGGSWSSGTALASAHPDQPADAAAISQIRAQCDSWAAPGSARTILLLGPAFSDHTIWAPLLAAAEAAHAGSTNAAATFDLRLPGVAPALIDLRPVTAVTDYYTADLQDDGSGDVVGLVRQVGLVVARLQALRPGAKLLLVGHSTAGVVATAYAAAKPGTVTGLVTLGTPHLGAPLVPLTQVPAADALRLVGSLLPGGFPAGPLQDAVTHLLRALDGYLPPPSAGALPIAWPYPVADFAGTGSTDTGGTPALALGSQIPGDFLGALKTALAARASAYTAATPTHLALGAAFALPLGSSASGAAAASATLRADIGRLALTTGATAPTRPAQALTATADLWRPGGWLTGGPLSYAGGGPLSDVRVRSLQAGLVVSLNGTALQATPFGSLHDAAFHGPTAARTGWADPAFALALGSAFSAIGTGVPAGSALGSLLAILQALTISTPPDASGAVGIAADALNALTTDALGFLAPNLPKLFAQNLIPGFSASPSGGYACQAGSLPIEAFVSLSPAGFGVRSVAGGEGLALGSLITLSGSITLPVATLAPEVALSLNAGPASLTWGSGALSLAVPVAKATLPLIPAPTAAEAKTALTALLPPLLISSVGSALLGGLAAEGSKITGLFSFLQSPWDWMIGTGGLGDGTGFDPVKLTALITSIGPLPAGLTLTATGKNPTTLLLATGTPIGGVLGISAGVALDDTGHASPAVSLTVDTPTTGSWPSIGLTFGISGTGLSLALTPAGLSPIALLPSFDGAAALAGAAKKLLPEALDALLTAVAPGPKPPLVTLALDAATALSLYNSVGGFSAHADALSAMLAPGWFATLSTTAQTAFLNAASAYFNDPTSPLHAALPGAIAVSGSALVWSFAAPPALGTGALSLTAGWDGGGPRLGLGVTNLILSGAPVTTTLVGGFANGAASLTGGLGVSLQSSLGIAVVPQLAFSFGAGAPSFALLPLGAGTAGTLALQFAPSFAFTHTSAAPAQLVEDWVVPLAADLLIGATGTHFTTPIFAGGPSIETLLSNAKLIAIGAGPAPQKYTLKTPLPAIESVLASLLQSLPTVPVTLVADPPLTLLLGNAGGQLGAALQGSIAISTGSPTVSLKFGQPGDAATVPGIALTLFGTGSGISFAPKLTVRGIGVDFAGQGSNPLFSASGFRIGEIDGFVAFTLDLKTGTFSGLGGGLELGQVGLPLNLLDSVSGGNPVASSLLGSDGGSGGGDSSAVNPALDVEVTYLAGTLDIKFSGTTQPIVIPIHASFGPLYIDQLDLALNGTTSVAIGIDGSLSLAGLTVAVDELGVLIPVNSVLKPENWSLDLQGLAVGFDSGPVEISGGLRKNPGPPIEYDGMLSAMISGLGLTVVGAYSRPTDAQGGYTSLFMFVSLPIPLGGPPFAFITGLGGGFGYNRELIVPTDMNKIPSFVLVEAIDGSALANDPMTALMQMSQSIPPKRGALWIAAGVRLTSFALVNSIVVVSIALDNGLDIEILGVSRMALPTEDVALISVELALKARFDTAEQVISVQAQLTDNSYLFSKSCQLTGGFALAIWYGDGQFVITLGGYNPVFSKPAKFPDVPRLGFNWSVSSIIVIKGGAYFALTNSCVMAGGSLSATASIGPISAWFNCYVDFLISWDPFAYEFDIGVEVGVSVHVRICFFGCVTIKISISTGASLMISGPPFHGTAAIDAYVTTVHVSFGDPPAPPPYITDWNVFAGKYLTAGDANESAVSIQFNTGLLPADPPGAKPQPGTADAPWQVGSEWSLTTTTRMPASSFPATLFGATVASPGAINALDLAAMDRIAVTSKHDLILRQYIAGGWGDPVITDGQDHFTIAAKAGFFPEASWHWTDPQHLPAAARTISAIAGFAIDAHVVLNNQSALIPISTLVADEPQYALPLPFAATLILIPSYKSFGAAAEILATAVATASSAQMLAAGAAILSGADFATNREAIGLTANGLPPLANQALRVSRSAPPLLTPLTTGLTMDPPGLPAPQIAETIATVGSVILAAPRLRAVLQHAAAPAADIAPAQATTLTGLAASVLRAAPRMSPPGVFVPAAVAGARLIVVPAVAAPRPTRAALPARALRHADFGAAIGPAHQAVLDQAARDVIAGGVTLGAGALHLWDVPDDQGSFTIAGTAALRMICLDRGGSALRDIEFPAAGAAAQTLPPGTAMVAIQCLGTLPDGAKAPAPGFAAITGQFAPAGQAAAVGWQSGSTLAQLGPSRFLARGARVRIVKPHAVRRNGQRASYGMPRAADVVGSQFGVETSLPLSTTVVMIALDANDAATGSGDLALAAVGGTLSVTPQRIVTGGRRLLIYDVTASEAKASALVVSVSSLADFRIGGVIGLRGTAADWAARLAAGVPDHFVQDTALSPGGALTVTYRGASA